MATLWEMNVKFSWLAGMFAQGCGEWVREVGAPGFGSHSVCVCGGSWGWSSAKPEEPPVVWLIGTASLLPFCGSSKTLQSFSTFGVEHKALAGPGLGEFRTHAHDPQTETGFVAFRDRWWAVLECSQIRNSQTCDHNAVGKEIRISKRVDWERACCPGNTSVFLGGMSVRSFLHFLPGVLQRILHSKR